MTPYLIQRANFADREHKKGIDRILSFDYVGSSEFEFGALGQSLKVIRENLSNYRTNKLILNNKSITVFHPLSKTPEILPYLSKLSRNEFRLKEYSDFDNFIYPEKSKLFKCSTDFWWDIENHIMWWKTDSVFYDKFCIAINE